MRLNKRKSSSLPVIATPYGTLHTQIEAPGPHNVNAGLTVRARSSTGGDVRIEMSLGPAGLGVRITSIGFAPKISTGKGADPHSGWYESKEIETCQYLPGQEAYREWYFGSGSYPYEGKTK